MQCPGPASKKLLACAPALSRSKDSMAIDSTRKEAPHAPRAGRAWQLVEATRGVPCANSSREGSNFARKQGTHQERRARRGRSSGSVSRAQAPRLEVSAHEMPLSNLKRASRVRPGTLQVEGLHGNRFHTKGSTARLERGAHGRQRKRRGASPCKREPCKREPGAGSSCEKQSPGEADLQMTRGWW
jgi:hypothetical protein